MELKVFNVRKNAVHLDEMLGQIQDHPAMRTSVSDRIDLRISKEQKDLIRLAAEISGFKNLSEFIIFCAKSEADKIISENDRFLHTQQDKKFFVETILNPPVPGPQLKKALGNYLKFRENAVDSGPEE